MSLRAGAIKKTTLCFVFDEINNSLLMIHKKRGQGAGKWNVPGGKMQEDETPEAAAIRETKEETGITPSNLQYAGKLEFYFPAGNSWDNICEVFTANQFSGQLITDGEECSASWVSLDKIPLEKMWDSDKRWLPLLLSRKKFHCSYTFDANDNVTHEKIEKAED
ncbi:MAG: 8-oxo-dGTP diphosphatase [Bacteriovoracia bacterium]